VTLSAELVISAASAKDFPRTALPEVAMVGRSNVGKSSLINALLKQKVARTSAAPGKTCLANYYLIEKSFYLVDLPGYGYARGGAASVEAFEGLTTQYFDPDRQAGRQLGGVLHLVDGRHPGLDSDAAAHEWLARTGAAIALVATKMDKLTQSERKSHLTLLAEAYDTLILPASVRQGAGLDDIWKVIRGWTHR
jgi:GTP-binding protein